MNDNMAYIKIKSIKNTCRNREVNKTENTHEYMSLQFMRKAQQHSRLAKSMFSAIGNILGFEVIMGALPKSKYFNF